MDTLDNLDRQILGYIYKNRHAMYGEIAGELGCQKILISDRIQNLFHLGYVEADDAAAFILSEEAVSACSFAYEQKFDDGYHDFDWEKRYIPLNLK